jgi:DNA-directed DNA polymerase III PolC
MATSFVPLRCRSNYSLLHGTASVDELLDHCARDSTGAMGLADLGGLYGAIDFYTKAADYSLKPLIGLEVVTEAGQILFFAMNLTGYGNLCRLSTIEKLHETTPTLEDIAAHRAGLVAIAFDTDYFDILREIFGENLYLGIVNLDDLRSRIRLQKIIRETKKSAPQLVAANPVAFLEEGDYSIHRALRAIGEIVPIDRLPQDKTEDSESYFRTGRESCGLFSEFPEAIRATTEITEKCNLELPVGQLNFPAYKSTNGKYNVRTLYELTSEGLHRRYKKITGEAISRLESELNIIERAGFTDYFLIVHEIIDFCRQNKIPCVGRGSAASSIVSYCLGITEVCPIEQNLYFQRFLNEARTDPPDIDIDLCWKRRDEVLEFVYDKYGRERVAMICTLNRFAVRGAVREVAKAFGLSGDEISDFTKRLPWGGSVGDLERRVETSPECRHLPIRNEPYKSIIEIAARIEGFPRHLGIHSGGIVIAPGDLLDWAPLQMSAKGIAITQYDMYSIDHLGLVKIDLLGQRGLSTIEEAKDMIGGKTGKRPEAIPNDDPETFDLLQHGKTIGVFQIESPGLRALLVAMQPKTIDDITLALALIRPGASESGMKKIFLERLAGRLPVEYPHPSLEPALKETLGNIIYQEQVLRSAEALAGFTPEQADLLRRAITKDRTKRDFDLMRHRFLTQAARRGVAKKTAASVFEMIAQFAGFGFCKAHAATYAVLSYRGAYLKAHHPIEYMAAMLNNFAGYYRSCVYAEEARRRGARLRPPTIDRPSHGCFTDGNDLYIGLAFVKNLTGGTIQRIIEARDEGPFTSLFDFLARARPSTDEAESLIKCGVLDCLGMTRPELLWLFKVYGEKRLKNPDRLPFLDRLSVPEPELSFCPALPDYDLDQRLAAETDILEMAVSCHPIERIATGNGHVKSADLPKLENKKVRIVGLVDDRKRIKTSNGRNMVFLTMEDEFDMFEVTLFPEVYRRFGERIFRKPVLDIEGTVQRDISGLTVVAERLEVVG